jgi:hypothetical protein
MSCWHADQLKPVWVPLCRLRWDAAGWLGLSLRHMLFVLPALCIALSQAKLSLLPGRLQRVVLAAAAVAAWGSQDPGMVASICSWQPWMRLSVVECGAALLLAHGLASVMDMLLSAGLSALQHILPGGLGKPKGHGPASYFLPSLVAASTLLQIALPTHLGCLYLAVRLAAAYKSGRVHQHGRAASMPARPSPRAWLIVYSQLVLVLTVALVSWCLGSRQLLLVWNDGRLLTVMLAVHACSVGNRCGSEQPPRPQRPPASTHVGGDRIGAAVHEVAACLAAIAALWGHPWLVVYAVGVSAMVDWVL